MPLKPNSSGRSQSQFALLEGAARTLPPYALPEVIEVIEALPRTSTDKIDRVTLRQRATSRRNSRTGQSSCVPERRSRRPKIRLRIGTR